MEIIYKISFILLLLLFILGSSLRHEDEQRNSADIHAQVTGMQDGTVYLIGTFESVNIRIDSSDMKMGHVHFAKDTLYPTGLYYLFYPNQSYFQILLDQDQEFSLASSAEDLVGKMIVSGSIDNTLLYESLRYDTRFQNSFDSLSHLIAEVSSEEARATLNQQQKLIQLDRKEYLLHLFNKHPTSFFTTFKKAGQNPDPANIKNEDGSINTTKQLQIYRTQFWSNVDLSHQGLLHTPVIVNKLKRHMSELTVQHPDSLIKEADFLMTLVADKPSYYKFFANWIVLNYEPTKSTIMDPESVFTHMVLNYFTHDKAFWSDSATIEGIRLRAYEMSKSLVGMPAPDINATDINGKAQRLLAKTSDYLIVYLFNPTCDHCLEQTPKLETFYRENKSKSIDVYAIGVDTDINEWRKYVSKSGLTFTNVFDPTYKSIYAKYYVDLTPEVYILNPKRIIIAKNIKVDQIEIIINRDRDKNAK
jgi:peroxiredoxin